MFEIALLEKVLPQCLGVADGRAYGFDGGPLGCIIRDGDEASFVSVAAANDTAEGWGHGVDGGEAIQKYS